MRPLQKRLGRQSLSNAMPKRRQIVDSCILFLTTSRSTEPPKRMPKPRHIVDSLTLLFTTSRSTEAAKHDAQSETNRRFLQSPFHDVQVDRRSQTRCPSRDYGRHKLKKYRFSMNVGRREAANLGTLFLYKNHCFFRSEAPPNLSARGNKNSAHYRSRCARALLLLVCS